MRAGRDGAAPPGRLGSAAALRFFGGAWLGAFGGPRAATLLFAWLLGVTTCLASGMGRRSAHRPGEPCGTLVLTLSVVVIEVALIAAVMLGPQEARALGCDTIFAVPMIVPDGMVGLGLLLGG